MTDRILTLDVGGTKIAAGLVDPDGTIVHRGQRPTPRGDAEAVWAAVEDVGSHVEWMADAEAIRFTSASTSGVGTTFECDTKVGPLRLTDLMEITRWEPGKAMGVRHVGLVTGEEVAESELVRAHEGEQP